MNRVSRLIRMISVGLLVAAIVQELRKPAEERTWHGRVAGFVPYDLRPPSLSRVIAAVWDPNTTSVLVPTPFGVGWTVNFRAANNFIRQLNGEI